MRGEKKFFDVFSRYKPSAEKKALLERGHSARFRYTKDPMRVEVDLSFDAHEDAELIYEIEDECRELYSAESFKILPHFLFAAFCKKAVAKPFCLWYNNITYFTFSTEGYI